MVTKSTGSAALWLAVEAAQSGHEKYMLALQFQNKMAYTHFLLFLPSKYNRIRWKFFDRQSYKGSEGLQDAIGGRGGTDLVTAGLWWKS